MTSAVVETGALAGVYMLKDSELKIQTGKGRVVARARAWVAVGRMGKGAVRSKGEGPACMEKEGSEIGRSQTSDAVEI